MGDKDFAPTWREHESLQQDLDEAFRRIVALEKVVNALCRASHQHVRLPDWESLERDLADPSNEYSGGEI